jgi:hypothetical protein
LPKRLKRSWPALLSLRKKESPRFFLRFKNLSFLLQTLFPSSTVFSPERRHFFLYVTHNLW